MSCSNKKETKLFGFIGLRVLKTALAVYICFLLSMPRGNSPFYSSVAAIISMKNDSQETINTGVNRIIGTLIGGAFGLATILIINYLDIKIFGHIHYLLLSLLLIPLIYLNIKLHSPSSTTISCIVFISIAVSHIKNSSPFMFAINRVIETSIGVLIAVVLNNLF